MSINQVKMPKLSLTERDFRWSRVREEMRKRGLDGLIVYGTGSFFNYGMANLRYLTNVGTHQGGVLLFPLSGEPVLFVLPPHMNVPFNSYSKISDWITDFRPFDYLEDIIAEVKSKGLEKGCIGLVGFESMLVDSTVPYSFQVALEKSLPNSQITDVTAMMTPIRMVKSDEEVEMLFKAGELAHKTIMQMWESARPGVTEADVYADMLSAQIKNGGEPHTFIFVSSGPVDDSNEWNLLHPVDPPMSPQMRVLQEGDLLITEFHSVYGGYLAAGEFSMVLGHAPEELLRIHEVSVECYNQYIEVMKPGVTVREVLEAVRKPCEMAGMDYVELGFHGHGLASPEKPAVVYKPDHARHGGGGGLLDVVLEENMVFGTNIDIHDPRWSKHIGTMLGDMILITKSGAKLMTNTPTDLFVKEV